jgi:DNA-binding NtrC family response regulator
MQIQADIACAISSGGNVLISGGDSSARTALARFIYGQDTTPNSALVVLDESKLARGLNAETLPRTGASRRTLFITELARLNRSAQQELMRLIDRTAADAGDAPDTRIISATAQRLVGPPTSPAFDARLFYRLNTIHIVLDDESGMASYTIH